MSEINERFGASAGKIWNILNGAGPVEEPELKRKSRLNNDDLYGAIGWLARENKIRRERESLALGDTNLIGEIGSRAGKVWQVLSEKGEVDVPTLIRRTELKRKDLFAALGWLAREEKLEADRNLSRMRLR